jgi:predicted DNA-binding protein YlxM (UPF0122 family)
VDRTYEKALLLDFYGALLTKRQLDILDAYVNDDYSLSEIAGNFDVSRQAVHDAVRNGVASLEEFEAKLGIVKAYHDRRRRTDRLVMAAEALAGRLESYKRESAASGCVCQPAALDAMLDSAGEILECARGLE